MNSSKLETIEQIRGFLSGTEVMEFSVESTAGRYAFIRATLVKFGYGRLGKADKGLIRRYLRKMTGYSRAQLTRLIADHRQRRLGRRPRPRSHFPKRYLDADIGRLAHTDEVHGTLSGPATKKVLEREAEVYGHVDYARLAGISIAHLYNLRKAAGYTQRRRHWSKTRPTPVAIGERRKPNPEGRPGYLRIDSVHQGDLDGHKGVYHINAIDAITQFEIVASVERISEAFLLPTLALMLEAFPFVIRGFHSDNGSEYVNKTVASLLNKLLIEFTKSRARRTNDNALVEGKNGAVVRKHLGYAHIPQKYARALNAFNRDALNPYLNFHRPCFFPEIIVDAKGKQRKRYPYERMMTPYEKLKSLPNAASFLKPSVTFEQLDAVALQMSDNEAAAQLHKARQRLFERIHEQPPQRPGSLRLGRSPEGRSPSP
ncbi:MAG: integrase catalytic domain-containing protein [Burkholderiales bacterium]